MLEPSTYQSDASVRNSGTNGKNPEQPNGATTHSPTSSISRSVSLPLAYTDSFETRHIGPNAEETHEMLSLLGFGSLDALIDATIPL